MSANSTHIAPACPQTYQSNPKDLKALEALAVTYAKLFKFDKAADLLDKLTVAKPQEAEAWRLLGEASLLSQQSKRSVDAYQHAAELKQDNMQVRGEKSYSRGFNYFY